MADTRTAAELLKNRLLRLRSRHGAVAEFCRKAGFSRQGVEAWLEGKSAPGLENIDAIAAALELEPWQLIAPEDMPAARVPPDLLELLAHAPPDSIAAVRAVLEGFAVGREKRALSGGQGAQELGNPAQKAKRKRT